MNLTDKIALVTGGTSGIGLAAARLLREQGASVAIVGSDRARLDEARAELGGDVLAIQADLRGAAGVAEAVEAVRRRFGRIDILLANAGKGIAAPLDAVTEEQIDEQFDLNFKGTFLLAQQAARLMAQGGSIVLTTSFLNEVAAPGLSILSATKAAVRSLARTLSAELAPRGIRVNALSPGAISTPFHGKMGLSGDQLKAVAEAIEAKVPLQRFGEADEVARAALFLASSDSAYVTGTELVVDGGLTQV